MPSDELASALTIVNETQSSSLVAASARVLADELSRLRAQRAAALELASDMHDVIHAACHRSGSTWGSVAEHISDRIRSALEATDE